MTEDGDVGFQINCVKKDDGKEVIVLPRARVDSHQMMEAGEIVCVYSGTCEGTYKIILNRLELIFFF